MIIVGGVAGGATAAARIRRLDEDAEIIIYEKSGYVSYANCGLPYYIGDVITDPSDLTLQTPESFWTRFRIRVKVSHEVTAVHAAEKAAGIDCESVVLSPSSHAGYYPDAKTMTMKVVFENHSLRLLGAQIIGSDGVDKRIDVLATAIASGVRADRLKELELAYAPPFSSAKDPVNMAGFMIENIGKGLVKQYHWEEVAHLPRDGSVTLLDTRTVREYERGHIEGYLNIPVDDLRDRIREIAPGKPVYLICQSGLRSYIAYRILMQHGFDCYNFAGGYRFYASVTGEIKMSERACACGMDR